MTQSRWLPYALIAPAMVFLGVFFIVPLVQTIMLSFEGGSGFGLENYAKMAGDLNFGLAIQNTFLLVLTVIPLQVGLALAMGMMLQKMTAGRDVVLWIWTIPLGVSDLAAGLVWLALLQNTGYINSMLFAMGLIDGPTPWLNSETPVTLFVAVVLAEVWRATAIVLVILVGQQFIDDGACDALLPQLMAQCARAQRFGTAPALNPGLREGAVIQIAHRL